MAPLTSIRIDSTAAMNLQEPVKDTEAILQEIIKADSRRDNTNNKRRPAVKSYEESYINEEFDDDDGEDTSLHNFEEYEHPTKQQSHRPRIKTPEPNTFVQKFMRLCNFFVMAIITVIVLEYFSVSEKLVNLLMKSYDKKLTDTASAIFSGTIVASVLTVVYLVL